MTECGPQLGGQQIRSIKPLLLQRRPRNGVEQKQKKKDQVSDKIRKTINAIKDKE